MLRKFLAGVLTGVMLFSTTAFAQNFDVQINFKDTDIKALPFSEVYPDDSDLIDEEVAFVPVKAIYDKLGFSSAWNPDTKTVSFNSGDYKFSFTANSDYYVINGSDVEAYCPAKIIDGCMYVSTLDFVNAVNEFYNSRCVVVVNDEEVAPNLVSILALNDEEYNRYMDTAEEFARLYEKYMKDNIDSFSTSFFETLYKCDASSITSSKEYLERFKTKLTKEEQKDFLDKFELCIDNNNKFIDELSKVSFPDIAENDIKKFIDDFEKSNKYEKDILEIHKKALDGESYEALSEEYPELLLELDDFFGNLISSIFPFLMNK